MNKHYTENTRASFYIDDSKKFNQVMSKLDYINIEYTAIYEEDIWKLLVKVPDKEKVKTIIDEILHNR